MPRQANDHVDSAAGVGARLKATRRAAGLTQTDLTFIGCSTAYVSRIEAGHRIPSLQVVRRLAASLGVDENWLAKGTTEIDPEQELLEAELELRFDELGSAEARYRKLLAGQHTANVRARAEAGLGQLAARRELTTDAIAHFERAAEIDPTAVDPGADETLGRAHATLGNEAEAIAVFRRRYDRAQGDGNTLDIVRFGVLLANALIDALDFAGATTALGVVIGAVPNMDPSTLARVRWSQARLATFRGETLAARRHATAALTLLESSEDRRQYAYAHHLLAFAELDAGNPEEALTLIERGCELLGSDATDYDEATFDIERARAYVQLGRLDEAASLAMSCATRFRNLHPTDFGRTYTELAGAFHAKGDRARAGELYELAIELLESRPTRFLAEAYARYGQYLEQEGDAIGAQSAYRSSAHLAANQPEPPPRP